MKTLFFYSRKAFQDMRVNGRISVMTILTISLCTLMMGALILFYLNGSRFISAWSGEVRLIVYLEGRIDDETALDLKERIKVMPRTAHAEFIPKTSALETLKETLPKGAGVLDTLDENPLPDAFIVTMNTAPKSGRNGLAPFSEPLQQIRQFADQLSELPHAASVTYGETWYSEVASLGTIFIISGMIIIFLSLPVILFVVGTTVKLSLFAKQDEFTIMRLVGATERFMAYPFYISAMTQGIVGSILGITALFLFFRGLTMIIRTDTPSLALSVTSSLSTVSMEIAFLPPAVYLSMVMGGMTLGWLGSFLAIRQHLKP